MILCVGTTPTVQRTMWFDRVRTDEVNRATRVIEYASGKSINVAKIVHQLGQPALATGFIGGVRGEFLRQDMERLGVPTDFVSVEQQTRLCTTVIDRAAKTTTELVEESASLDGNVWADIDEKMRQLLPKAKVCVFSGSLPPAAPQDFYARYLPQAREQGTLVIVDGRGEPLQQCLAHEGFIAKLNREELGATVGHALDTDKLLRDAMAKTCPKGGAILITMGAAGAAASDGRRFWRLRSPKINAVNPIGSGDAVAAGIAVAHMTMRGADPVEHWKLGIACGAANALTEKAGDVRPQDLERLVSEVGVEEMSDGT